MEARKAWDKLVGREEEVVTVKVTRAVKGGLAVEFEGLRGFIPASMIDSRFTRNTERFVGQELEAKLRKSIHLKTALSYHVVRLLKQKLQQCAPKYLVSCQLVML